MTKFIFILASAGLLILSFSAVANDHVVKPQKMSKSDISGDIFSRPDTIK